MADAAAPAPPPAEPAAAEAGGEGEAEAKPAVELTPEEQAKATRQAEVDKKRAEVRRKLEEAAALKRAKKGFMTPERKKKLRLLLRKKAAEELRKEQERKAEERRVIIHMRCGNKREVDDVSEAEVKEICKYYYKRVYDCEAEKWDLEWEVQKREFEIADLNASVNDLRGKFIKPPLKKVSKYDNKFAKLQKKAAEFNFRNQLKQVKKKEFTIEEEDKKQPDWAKKAEKPGVSLGGIDEAPAEGAAPGEPTPAPTPVPEGVAPTPSPAPTPEPGAPSSGAPTPTPGDAAPTPTEAPATPVPESGAPTPTPGEGGESAAPTPVPGEGEAPPADGLAPAEGGDGAVTPTPSESKLTFSDVVKALDIAVDWAEKQGDIDTTQLFAVKELREVAVRRLSVSA